MRCIEDCFPILYNIAMDYLAIQATSVDVERQFSKAGRLCDKLRSRLLPETVHKCLSVHSWNEVLEKSKYLRENKNI